MSGILCGSGPRVFPPTFLAPSSQLFCCSRFFFLTKPHAFFVFLVLLHTRRLKKKKKTKKRKKLTQKLIFVPLSCCSASLFSPPYVCMRSCSSLFICLPFNFSCCFVARAAFSPTLTFLFSSPLPPPIIVCCLVFSALLSRLF